MLYKSSLIVVLQFWNIRRWPFFYQRCMCSATFLKAFLKGALDSRVQTQKVIVYMALWSQGSPSKEKFKDHSDACCH